VLKTTESLEKLVLRMRSDLDDGATLRELTDEKRYRRRDVCECCGTETSMTDIHWFYGDPVGDPSHPTQKRTGMELCALCAEIPSFLLSRRSEGPSGWAGSPKPTEVDLAREVVRVVCRVGNQILEEVRRER